MSDPLKKKKKKVVKQRLYADDGECSGKRNTSNKRRLARKEKGKAEKEIEKRQRVAESKLNRTLEQRAAEREAAEKTAAAEQAAALKAEGNALFLAGEHGAAAAKYREAIAVDEELHLLHSNLAACLLATEEWALAEAAAKRCTELAPDFVKGHFRLATALREQGKHAAAATAARAGIQECGYDPALGDIRNACDKIVAAIPPVPLPPRSFNERGIVLPDSRVTHPGVIKRRKGQMLLASTSKGQLSEKQLRNKKAEDRSRKTKVAREYHNRRTAEHLDAWDKE